MEAQLMGGTPTGVADAVVGDLAARAKSVAGIAAAHAMDRVLTFLADTL